MWCGFPDTSALIFDRSFAASEQGVAAQRNNHRTHGF
jgi:hypothetical protein